MKNFFQKTSTWAVIAVIVIAGMAFWAYKVGVFSGTSSQSSAISYKGEAGKTALDLLKSKYKVETQNFESTETVTSINGKTADDKHFWGFSVNGKPATVSPGQYVTADDDTVVWELKEINTSL